MRTHGRTNRTIRVIAVVAVCASLGVAARGQGNAPGSYESPYLATSLAASTSARHGFAAAESPLPSLADPATVSRKEPSNEPAKEDQAKPGKDDGLTPIPLKPRSASGESTAPFGSSSGPKQGGLDSKTSQLVGMGGSLAAVLGLFFLFAWMLRRTAPKGQGALPKEVIETLGRAPLSAKQFVHLIRVGNKMILVSVTPDGAKTLTEITDPAEVDHLAGLCEQTKSGSSSQAFRRVLQSLAPRRPSRIDALPDDWEEQHA